VGEAIRLQLDHVKLALQPPQLHILETKFHKSRIVPLHPSTAEHLRHYGEPRARLHYDGLSDAFFVSERGQPLQYLALHNWFARLCQRVAIAPTTGGRSPCLMSFRHTFASPVCNDGISKVWTCMRYCPTSRSTSGTSTRTKVIGT
jgi:integrase